MFKRKGKYSLEEVHAYIADIANLQEQRSVAQSLPQDSEVEMYSTLIEHAQLVLERLLENV